MTSAAAATQTRLPLTRETTNRTMKIINRIFAIEAAVPAMPPKPSMPAIRAMMRKVTA